MRGRGESRPQRRRRAAVKATASAVLALGIMACDGAIGGADDPTPGGNAELVRVEFGRLADVYARELGGGIRRVARDVLIGTDIGDGKPVAGLTGLRYRMLSPDARDLQLRLLIDAAEGSAEFRHAFQMLSRTVRTVLDARVDPLRTMPFSLVPRNCGLRLTFSHNLGVDDDFFVARDANGNITGLRNTEAVQLLQIAADPNNPPRGGAFVPIPARIAVHGKQIILDPVLLGDEGPRWGWRNTPTGLPPSDNQRDANIRIAIALDGPLSLPGVRPATRGALTGWNGTGNSSIVRDFRAGNANDTGSEVSRGFVRDATPPRLIGRVPFLLERVTRRDPTTLVARLYKDGLRHEIDAGDALVIRPRRSGSAPIFSEVLVDPDGDRSRPEVGHVDVVVPDDRALLALDPSTAPGYPTDPQQLPAWLRQNAPRAVLVAPFEGSRRNPAEPTEVTGDDPALFIRFAPGGITPRPHHVGVDPFASVAVEFSKPVALDSVRPHDTLFLAMHDAFDRDALEAFRLGSGPARTGAVIPRASFNADKFITPYLVGCRALDENGSQTLVRLSPMLGLYLDETVRERGIAFEQRRYRYFAHLRGGAGGVEDLAGEPLDLGFSVPDPRRTADGIAVPFALDADARDNRVAYCVRRLQTEDEDERPSYHRDAELPGQPFPAAAPIADLFGAAGYDGNGRLVARPTSRSSGHVDARNQPAPPSWACANGEAITRSASAVFGQGVQNPMNPLGARLQSTWREMDLGLSCEDPADFNLDIEQMWWAPFQLDPVLFDEFDRTSLFLSHAEWRPENCVNRGGLPAAPGSGLRRQFDENAARNLDLLGEVERRPQPVAAFVDQIWTMTHTKAITGPQGQIQYLPMPPFQRPYFVWRDETATEQGGRSSRGNDRITTPYLCSPFLGGAGEHYAPDANGNLVRVSGTWSNFRNSSLSSSASFESITDGLLASIALPLLADFWVYPDSPTLPAAYPFMATGFNGWQVSLGIAAQASPSFRVVSAGGRTASGPIRVEPQQQTRATGGFDPAGNPTAWGDNTVYWVRADFLRRMSVATAGFVDVRNPHRMPASGTDPRLGPYAIGTIRSMQITLDPPATRLPAGTSVRPQMRAAGAVDPSPWRALALGLPLPTAGNVDLDPLKAGDAHIRKFDDRGGTAQWTHFYHRNITDYRDEPEELLSPHVLAAFASGNEPFGPDDIVYVNWRLVFENNVDTPSAVAPSIDSTVLAYRF